MKAKTASQVQSFSDIPNIGPAMIKDFAVLGIKNPEALKTKNPYTLYKELCAKTKTRHDPCVLDTFIAAVDFMCGAPARPWWYYTKQRKAQAGK